ncbi:hypothetical protein MKEN_01345800 [Mycena kentingensis (nom. inval.)]|nr:hypothetical protein MKEN_01345800 [Mycena kentingensis (nom. inval.)]
MEPRLKTSTCVRCKKRKIRCDGDTPSCKTCVRMDATCEYDEGRSGGKAGTELKRGAACIPCRRKKKRCDGRFPCNTCAASRSKTQCDYDDADVHPEPTSSSNSSSDSPRTPQDDVVPAVSIVDPSPFVALELPDYVVLSDLSQARGLFLNNAGLSGFPIPTFDEPHPHPVPPPPKDPMYDIAIPQGLPLPEAPRNDELAAIRQLFLAHRIQFGLSMRHPSLVTIAEGTPDGPKHAHAVLIYAVQLLGYMLARHRPDGEWFNLPGQSDREAEQTRAVLAVLQDSTTVACPFAYVHTTALMSQYFFNKGDIGRARDMVALGFKLIQDHSLHSVDFGGYATAEEVAERITRRGSAAKPGFKVEPVSRVGDAIAAIAHLVYLDISYSIITHQPSLLDPETRDSFHDLVLLPYSDAEINYTRAKSALLFSNARQMVVMHKEPLSEPCKESWQGLFWELIDALDAHRSFLNLLLTRIAFCPAHHRLGLALKVCLILTLTGTATLLAVFEGDNREVFSKKQGVIAEVIQLSSGFQESDFPYLDPILSVCWYEVMRTVRKCMVAEGLGFADPSYCGGGVYDAQQMAKILRARNTTLKKVLPFAVDI